MSDGLIVMLIRQCYLRSSTTDENRGQVDGPELELQQVVKRFRRAVRSGKST
jgi:hypothetical protein